MLPGENKNENFRDDKKSPRAVFQAVSSTVRTRQPV